MNRGPCLSGPVLNSHPRRYLNRDQDHNLRSNEYQASAEGEGEGRWGKEERGWEGKMAGNCTPAMVISSESTINS